MRKIERIGYRFGLLCGFYKPQKIYNLALDDRELGLTISSTKKYFEKLDETQTISIIFKYKNDVAFLTKVNKGRYPLINPMANEKPLVTMARANLSLAKAIFSTPDFFVTLSMLDVASIIAHHNSDQELITALSNKDPNIFKNVKIDLIKSSHEHMSRKLLLTIKRLFDECTNREKVNLFKLHIEDHGNSIYSMIYNLAMKEPQAAVFIAQTKPVLNQLKTEDLVEIICRHHHSDIFCNDFFKALENNTLVKFANESKDFAEKIFSTDNTSLIVRIPDIDRYKLARKYGQDFLFTHFKHIIFNRHAIIDFKEEHFQGEIAELNKALLSSLSNKQIFSLIKMHANSSNFIANFNFVLEKTTDSLQNRIMQDSDFAENIFSLKNELVFKALKAPSAIAIHYGKKFIFKHFQALIIIASNDCAEAIVLFSNQDFLEKFKSTLSTSDFSDAIKLCEKFSGILEFFSNQNDFTNSQAYEIIKNHIRVYLIAKSYISVEIMKSICENDAFKIIFDQRDKEALSLYYKKEVFDVESNPRFSDAINDAKDTQAKDALKKLIEGAKDSSLSASSLLNTADLYKKLSSVTIAEIIVSRVEDEFFLRDLRRSVIGPKDCPVNVHALAMADKDAAVVFLKSKTIVALMRSQDIDQIIKTHKLDVQEGDSKDKKHYDLLQLNITATANEIKRAYIKLSRATHSDKNVGKNQDDPSDDFNKIQEAYEAIYQNTKDREEIRQMLADLNAKPVDQIVNEPVASAKSPLRVESKRESMVSPLSKVFGFLKSQRNKGNENSKSDVNEKTPLI